MHNFDCKYDYMRLVTLTGSMRLYALLQLPTTDVLEVLVKRGLQENGWGVQSVSISRNSYLNNTLGVTIVITALGNDVSRRIEDGVSNFLRSYLDGGETLFRDVSLRVSKDTGVEGATTTVGAQISQTPKVTVMRVIKVNPTTNKATPKTTDVGFLGVVNVRADSTDEQSLFGEIQKIIDELSATYNISKSTVMIGGALFAILILKRI